MAAIVATSNDRTWMQYFVALGQDIEKLERVNRAELPTVRFVNLIVQFLIMLVVGVNVIIVGVETQVIAYERNFDVPVIYTELEIFFLTIYIIEFLLKFYTQPIGYWKNTYNRIDFLIVVLCIAQWVVMNNYFNIEVAAALRVIKALRASRAFRGISFTRNLQVVVNALVNTLRKNVVDIIVLLLLLMFIFGVLGHYLFGAPTNEHTYKDWGTMGSAFMTLFVYVCADGWLKYQDDLDKDGFTGSEIFTAFFIFVGNFIIANLFIGVICQNIDDATAADRKEQELKKKEAKLLKRELFLQKQRTDMSRLVAQTASQNRTFQELIKEMVGTLRHEDVVPMTHIACNLTWLETFSVTLTHQENTMYRCQQLQFAIANTLAEYVDRRLKSRLKQER